MTIDDETAAAIQNDIGGRVIVTNWDEKFIAGDVISGDTIGVAISLTDKHISFFESSTNIVSFEASNLFINTEYVPAACVRDLSIAVHHADGTISHLKHPCARPLGNARTNSLFGGMWVDRADWEEVLALKEESGEITEPLSKLIRDFVRDGYVVIPKAVTSEIVAQLNSDIDEGWGGKYPGLKIEVYSIPGQPHAVIEIDQRFQNETHKVLDSYVFMPSAMAVAAAPAAVDFMAAIFEEKPKAFQQLTFGWGSQQAIHKDTAYVKIDGNPMSMLATWVALEDISEGTGELEYYVGSHKAPDYVFGGVSKWLEASPNQFDDFLAALHRDAEQYEQPKSKFLAKAGDVLIWHADLAHGGSAITKPGISRKSIVTHYTACRNDPYYRRWSDFSVHEFNNVQFVSAQGPVRT